MCILKNLYKALKYKKAIVCAIKRNFHKKSKKSRYLEIARFPGVDSTFKTR